jgi:hypothetical protein
MMTPNISRLLLILMLPALCGEVVAMQSGGGLAVSLTSLESSYCLDGKTLNLELRLHFSYTNTLAVPILLLRITRLGGYSLSQAGNADTENRTVDRVTLNLSPALDTTKLRLDKPNPKLFEVVQPGETIRREQLLTIPVRPPRAKNGPALRGEYLLRVDLDHWPGNRAPINSLTRNWEEVGRLWTAEITSAPIKIKIAENPLTVPCGIRID